MKPKFKVGQTVIFLGAQKGQSEITLYNSYELPKIGSCVKLTKIGAPAKPIQVYFKHGDRELHLWEERFALIKSKFLFYRSYENE